VTDYLFLCLFFRSFFLRLWVAIFLSLRFLPQGTSGSPCLKIKKAAKAATETISTSMKQAKKKVNTTHQGTEIPNSEFLIRQCGSLWDSKYLYILFRI
jgi:hypothetical protein